MKQIPLKPGQKAVCLEMTEEMKSRFSKAAVEATKIIIRHTNNPAEAFAVLHFVKDALEHAAGVKYDRTVVFGEKDLQEGTPES